MGSLADVGTSPSPAAVARIRRRVFDRFGARAAARFLARLERDVLDPVLRLALAAYAVDGRMTLDGETFTAEGGSGYARWLGQLAAAEGDSAPPVVIDAPGFADHAASAATFAAGLLIAAETLEDVPLAVVVEAVRVAFGELFAAAADAGSAQPAPAPPPDYQQPPTQLRDVGALLLAPRPGPAAGETLAA